MVEALVRIDNQPRKELDPTTRTVVTGMGSISPLGLNTEEMWANLIAGRSGIKKYQFRDYPQIESSVAGLVEDFDALKTLEGVIPKKEIMHRLHRSAHFSLAASLEALNQAGLLIPNLGQDSQERKWTINTNIVAAEEVATIIGTGIGGGGTIYEVGKDLDEGKTAKPHHVLKTLPERVATPVTMAFGLKGPAYTVVAACATGNYAISCALKEIMAGDATLAIVGSSDASLIPTAYSMFDCMYALDREPDPTKASRPFDKSRGGFVLAEGAAILVLERLDFARKRGAKILAEVASYGNTADAYHDTEPSGDGAIRAMRIASERAMAKGVSGPLYINAHATGTKADPIEMNAIKAVHDKSKKYVVGVSATKSSTGHLLGAAGALESIICIKTIQTGILPPTTKLKNPVDEADGWNLVPNDAQKAEVTHAQNNSLGFGGLNSTTEYSAY